MKKIIFNEAIVAGLLCLLIIAGTFACCHDAADSGKFLRNDWLPVLLWFVPLVIVLRRVSSGRPDTQAQNVRQVAPAGFVLIGMLVLYLFSGATKYPSFYFMNWFTRAGPACPGPDCTLDLLVLGTVFLVPLSLFSKRGLGAWLPLLFIGLQALCAAKLALATGGHAVYQDDNPSFMFRLQQFKAVFPHLLTYNPYWNAGTVDSVLADTGSVAFGIFAWPFIALLPPHKVYTLCVAVVYILVVPWTMVLSARLMKLDRLASWCAGILGIGASYTFFLWALHFGTVGSVLCSVFLVPVAACMYRVIWLDHTDWKLAVILCFSSYILVQWPPGMLMAATLVVSAVLSGRQWSWRKIAFLAGCTAVVLALHARALILILTKSHDLVGFVMQTPAPPAEPSASGLSALGATLRGGWFTLMGDLMQGHPVIIFLGIAGVFFLPQKALRIWLGPPVLLLALLAGWGGQLFPNLQISRMVIPLFLVAAIPAAIHIGHFLAGVRKSERWVSAFLLAILALGGWNTGRIYGNGGYARFAILGDDVENMVESIRTHCPEGSRVLFAGRAVHGFGRGHIAYLPILAGREMMACDYYAFPPAMVEYEYPPRPFRASEEGTARFLKLHNVSLILTYHRKWRDYFVGQADRYRELPSFDITGVHVYAVAVRAAPSAFLSNSGTIKADFNRLRVSVDDPGSDAVITYNWEPQLRADGEAELFEYDAGDGIQLVGIRPNGESAVDIHFRSGL